MNDTVLFITVIAGALILILGVAFLLDQRRKATNNTESKVPPGPISRLILWTSYVVLVITILFIIASFVFHEIVFATFARNFIFLYIIIGIVYRIVRPRGM